jgi:hypothetical protein
MPRLRELARRRTAKRRLFLVLWGRPSDLNWCACGQIRVYSDRAARPASRKSERTPIAARLPDVRAECAALPTSKSPISKPRPAKRRRSRDYNARALAIAKKAIGQFSGELANPILVDPVSPGLAAAALSKRHVVRTLREKFFSLFGHFGIEPKDPDGWLKLSWHLSINLVPGFITVVKPALPRQSRSDKFWTPARYKALVFAVDKIRLATGNGTLVTIESAVFQLVDEEPKSWGAYKNKDTLITRYHEGQQLIEEEARRESLKGLPLGAKEWLDLASDLDLTGRRTRVKKPATQRHSQRQPRKSAQGPST